MPDEKLTTLWRPVGQRELELIAESGYRAFPPRLPHQPIFYPVGESWTGRDAWWLQVPVPRLLVMAGGAGAVHLVCEASPGGQEFHYLRVPAAFLRDHLAELDTPGDGRMISLF